MYFNTLRPRESYYHFKDDIFKCFLLNQNAWISLKISLKFISNVQINYIPTLVQIMAWHRQGDKPLSEPMMANLLTYICVPRSQWVNFIHAHAKFQRFHWMSEQKPLYRNYTRDADIKSCLLFRLVISLWKFDIHIDNWWYRYQWKHWVH